MQFGFRAHHSTEAACCYFLEVIKARLEKRSGHGAVFLDFCKAFNTINHSVLSKLPNFKLSVNILKWLKSHLTDCSQCVKNWRSSLQTCSMGVPQGLILCPLLFCTCITDLPVVCDEVETITYVDDTVLFTHAKNADKFAAKLSEAMDKAAVWLAHPDHI